MRERSLYRDSADAIEDTWRTRAAGISLTTDHQLRAASRAAISAPGMPIKTLGREIPRDEDLIRPLELAQRMQRAKRVTRIVLMVLAFGTLVACAIWAIVRG